MKNEMPILDDKREFFRAQKGRPLEWMSVFRKRQSRRRKIAVKGTDIFSNDTPTMSEMGA